VFGAGEPAGTRRYWWGKPIGTLALLIPNLLTSVVVKPIGAMLEGAQAARTARQPADQQFAGHHNAQRDQRVGEVSLRTRA
jgi:hypothetical protein